ncbi:hypothetical protein F4553_001034 [Allocatelliglobosispora scoriae]|uniref:Hemerythrin-like domain-containing protein n=1 Tax=Allocatelliglobosispora scoriae TaxID=643052 RepID=A0A841BJ58_9ACTN|nr:hemerythrin domain-containing protein [Allocatelliglobosispora scoriae]MBB5867655.1 hypothetical protein [Allocatelliglobosispora scoriae]
MMPHDGEQLAGLDALNPPEEFGGRSIVEVLDEEHRELDKLMVELMAGETEPERRAKVATIFTAALSRHLSAEEQDLYPTARSVLPNGKSLADTEIAEDTATLRELMALESTDVAAPEFDSLLARLDARLQRHTHVVGAQMLPELEQHVTREKLVRLGNRVAMDNEAAPTRPHPSTPSRPPWNWMVDPAMGAIDKVRDAMAGRKVYPEDL